MIIADGLQSVAKFNMQGKPSKRRINSYSMQRD